MAESTTENAPRLDPSTRFAADRTRLAYERTMLAWIRIGTSLITFGFGVYKFFQIERKPSAQGLPDRPSGIRPHSGRHQARRSCASRAGVPAKYTLVRDKLFGQAKLDADHVRGVDRHSWNFGVPW